MKRNRFIIDTNTLVSAFIFEHSKPARVLDKVRGSGALAFSLETYSELCEVLLRPKFDKYISLDKRNRFLANLKKEVAFSKIMESITDCRDPKDNKFLELAIAGQADCIITGDNDLLVLHPFRKIPILNASDFLVKF